MSQTEKDEHLKKAGEYLSSYASYEEKIESSEVRKLLKKTSDSLRELRDTQVYFESGEKELQQLYDRYLPYLDSILKEYIKIESSGNYEALQKSEKQLKRTLQLLIDAMNKIRRILPEDEMAEASAEAAAERMKKKLNGESRLK